MKITTPTRPAQISRNVIQSPPRFKFEENSRFAVARLASGEPFLCGAELYGPHFAALGFLADAVRISRGRP